MRGPFALGFVMVAACSLVVDGALDGKEAGSPCQGADDGAGCELEGSAARAVCRAQACTVSVCGDGIVDGDGGEACDDGNDDSGDGCEPVTCAFTCETDADCEDLAVCNGVEVCDEAANTCRPGDPAADELTCTLEDDILGECRAGLCRVIGCGNGLADDGEACDDGNQISNDGCEPDCTVTCFEDADCARLDTTVCDGADTCDTDARVCVGGETLDCDDADACTADSCDPVEGCVNDPLPFDMDMDGHPNLECGGDDCRDDDPTTFGGAEELCADAIDNDCDGMTDESAPFWYFDCDGDGFAPDTNGQTRSCTAPAESDGCGWTTTRPVDLDNTDCNDGNAAVFPGQRAYSTMPIPGATAAVDFDYDCDGDEVASAPIWSSSALSCTRTVTGCSKRSYWAVGACGALMTHYNCEPERFTGSCAYVQRRRAKECR